LALAALPGWLRLHSSLSAKLTTALAHPESARAVGAEYLRQYPQEADAQLLLKRIVARFDGGYAALTRAHDSTLRTLIEQRVRQDFATEQIVKVQGWVLSATEARLCALMTLLA
jgi:hypothetical protein